MTFKIFFYDYMSRKCGHEYAQKSYFVFLHNLVFLLSREESKEELEVIEYRSSRNIFNCFL